ncbi:MAG: hypothetical protein K1000chlam2_00104 [Chlamydiae bacterium]|nr:hypothetical protein [Chlamydiota bacterium]
MRKLTMLFSLTLFGFYLIIPINGFTENPNVPDSLQYLQEDYKTTELLPFDCKGWSIHEKIFNPMFEEKNISSVIEVGVFLGNWTLSIAKKLPEDGVFYAIDHWEGSIEHQEEDHPQNSYLPTLYEQFLSNILHKGFENVVVPVKMDSLKAARLLRRQKIQVDLVYIDASHDYNSVLRDLHAWLPMVKKGGILCGDDWHWGGVRQAVINFAEIKKFKIYSEGNFWMYEM